jgi:hypothetical protein
MAGTQQSTRQYLISINLIRVGYPSFRDLISYFVGGAKSVSEDAQNIEREEGSTAD